MLVSEGQEIEMGRQADAEATAAYGLYPDQNLQAYVSQLGKRMAVQSERPNLPWSFKVVDDPAVNAFALPGGYIYVTRGIMAHLQSEAELMGVVGHEIGHVTARHSASAISRQQLAMGGLVLGMIVKPELQRFGGLAQQGLGVLFLKFGRDQEIQADDLGLRYMTRQAYDPKEMVEVFNVLDRVSGQASDRLPDWLSTHPSPGNRVDNISKEIARTGVKGNVVRRNEYVRYLDGMVFGDNPRDGYFMDTAFYHPDLHFQLRFPQGFKVQNGRDAVVGVSAQQDAVVALGLAQGNSPEQAAKVFFQQEGVEAGRSGRDTINGLPAYTAFFTATTDQGSLRGQATWVTFEGKLFRLMGYSSAERFVSYQNAVDGTLRSFARLTDPRYLNVEPKRLALVNLDRGLSVGDFARTYPSTVKLETLGLINGVVGNALIATGPAKRVVGGRLPGEQQ